MTTGTQRQIIFLDPGIPDIADLIDGARPSDQVFVLQADGNGLEQIADILASENLSGLDSIAIVSHGDTGELRLGSALLTDGNLAGNSGALAEIGAALAPGGTIQLYGCDVAQGATGQRFIDDFSILAGGATVEAATHIVGDAASGGNWALDAAASAGAPAAPPPKCPSGDFVSHLSRLAADTIIA